MVIVDKDWAERAALALPAHMNLTGLMIEIDLAKNRKGNESQKSNSIKNELKKKKELMVCHFFLYFPILFPPLPTQISPKAITWGPASLVSVVGLWNHSG